MLHEEDQRFVQAAVKRGFMTPEDVRAVFQAVERCEEMGRPRTAAEVAVARGVLSNGQFRQVLEDIGRRVFRCPQCRIRFYASDEPGGDTCPRCGGRLGAKSPGMNSWLGADPRSRSSSEAASSSASEMGTGPLSSPPGPPYLQLIRDGFALRRLDLTTEGIAFGRAADCEVILNESLASRHHTRLLRREGKWIAEDLQSRNGTFINETRIEKCPLRHLDLLRIGETLFIYRDDAGWEPPPGRVVAWLMVDDGRPHPPIAVTSQPVLIGSDPQATVCCEAKNVLPYHAHVMAGDWGAQIISFATPDRTRINGQESKARILRDGDRVELGDVGLTVRSPSRHAAVCNFFSDQPAGRKYSDITAGSAKNYFPSKQEVPGDSLAESLAEEAKRIDSELGVEGELADIRDIETRGKRVRELNLTCTEGPMAGQTFLLKAKPLVIGRAEECHIRIDDEGIAWKHAWISRTGSNAALRDLGNYGHMRINNRSVKGEGILHPGDALQVGSAKFAVHL